MIKVRNWLIAGIGALGILLGSGLSALTLSAGQSVSVAAHAPQATVYDT